MIDGENKLKIFQYIVANTKKVENEYCFSGFIEQMARDTNRMCCKRLLLINCSKKNYYEKNKMESTWLSIAEWKCLNMGVKIC